MEKIRAQATKAPGAVYRRLYHLQKFLLAKPPVFVYFPCIRSAPGEVVEWFMAPVLKTGVAERSPWVRIPPSPPPFACNDGRV